MMNYVNLVFCMLLLLTTTLAQSTVELEGKASIFVEGDQLILNEGDAVTVDVNAQNLIISQSDKNLRIDIEKGFRIFRFEREGIYKRIEYSYLLTDYSRMFLAEMKFLVAADGDRIMKTIKSITNYKEDYTQIDKGFQK